MPPPIGVIDRRLGSCPATLVALRRTALWLHKASCEIAEAIVLSKSGLSSAVVNSGKSRLNFPSGKRWRRSESAVQIEASSSANFADTSGEMGRRLRWVPHHPRRQVLQSEVDDPGDKSFLLSRRISGSRLAGWQSARDRSPRPP